MRTPAKRMAVCAMMAAVCVVLMVLGAVLELGMYAAPLLGGLCFIPVGQIYGRKYHVILFVVSAVLCFLFVPNLEQNLVFAGLLGWYPILHSSLQKLPKWLRLPIKLLLFNAIIVGIEYLVMTVLVPEIIGGVLLWILLILGNVTFLAYDFMLPRLKHMLMRITRNL